MVDEEAVKIQLERILQSAAFSNSARCSQFLRFCVHRTVDDLSSQLKETTIAVEIFHRPADYDPKFDPIVRVHATRVRERLHTYYRTIGRNDPIRIDIPKGGYVPRFTSLGGSDRNIETGNRLDEEGGQLVGGKLLTEEDEGPRKTQLPGGHKHRSLYWMLGMALLVASLFCLAWNHEFRAKNPNLAIGQLIPIDTLPESTIADTVWSPDGTQLAFAALNSRHPQWQIYVQDLKRRKLPERLTDDEVSESKPVWSPDGREVAFVERVDSTHFEIEILNLESHKRRSLGRFTTFWRLEDDHPVLDWSPDGRYMVTAEQSSPLTPLRLTLISIDDGERRPLTSPPSGVSGDVEAKFSPDGKLVAFRRGAVGDLYVVSVSGEKSQAAIPLTRDMRGVRGIAWADGGKAILYGTQRGASFGFRIWSVPLSGGTPVALSPEGFDARSPTLAKDGSLAITHRVLETDLIEQSLDGKMTHSKLISSHQIDYSPRYSPDGNSIAFLSTRSGSEELWLSSKTGGTPKQLSHFNGTARIFYPSWSHDGKRIAFSLRRNGATVLYTYTVLTGAGKQLTFTNKRHLMPVYSNDDKYLYYYSNDDGITRLWRMNADGQGHPEALFWDAIGEFAISDDGKWIYFLRADTEVEIIRGSLQDHTSKVIFRTHGRPSFLSDLEIHDGRVYLAVSQNAFSSADLFCVDGATERSRVLTHLTSLAPPEYSGFSISPDGTHVIVPFAVRNETLVYTARLSVATHSTKQ